MPNELSTNDKKKNGRLQILCLEEYTDVIFLVLYFYILYLTIVSALLIFLLTAICTFIYRIDNCIVKFTEIHLSDFGKD